MIPPRVSLDNEIEREPCVGAEPDLQRSLGPLYDTPCVARFPGWPHGNRTHNGSTSVARKARSRTWGPLPRTLFAFPIWAPYGLYMEAIHRECTICSFAVLSPLPRYVHRYLPLFPRFPPILTVSLITGATRTARVISAYTRTPFLRAIGGQDEEHIENPSATISSSLSLFFSRTTITLGRKRICKKKKRRTLQGRAIHHRGEIYFIFLIDEFCFFI